MDRHTYEQAVEWYVQLNNGDATPAMREEFARWLLLSPEHISAFLEVSRASGDIGPAAQELSREELIRTAREKNGKSNVVRLSGEEPAAVPPAAARKTIGRCCLIALATIALLTSVMAVSWLTRDRWLCRTDVAHTSLVSIAWI